MFSIITSIRRGDVFMATKPNEKFLVNGQPMTNAEYLDLLKKAREAQGAYKRTPAYKAEQEAKIKADADTQVNIKKFELLAESLRLPDASIAKIGLVIYNKYRTKPE